MPDYTHHTNPLSTDTEKDSEAFGLRVIKAAFESWKKGSGTSNDWSARKARFDVNRSYAVGKQSTQEFRDMIEIEGIPAQVSLDYSPLPLAVPFVKRILDRYGPQRLERVECNAIDPYSQSLKKKAKQNAIHKLKEKDRIKEIQDFTGVPLEEFSDDDPQDENEINLEFGFNYKLKEEVIMEGGLDIVFYDNQWDEVMKNPILFSVICTGFAAVKVDLDANGRIKYTLIKSENFISSYSEKEDFSDWEWQGCVYSMRISEIRLKYPGKFSEQRLFELAKTHAGKNDNGKWSHEWSYGGDNIATPWDAFTVLVVDLDYKTLYNLHYEKNKDRFGKEILDKTRKFKEGKEYQSSPPYYVSYTGLWIVDTEHMLEWGLTKSMIKPEQNLVEILSRYAVFLHDNIDMNNTPMIETAIPTIKAMHNIHYQTQKLIASTAPDGSNIDVKGLSNIDMGAGVGNVTPMQLYRIYLQTGNQYFEGFEDGDDIDSGKRGNPPITPSNIMFSNKLEQLDRQYEKEYNKLLNIFGSNNLDQGNITNQAVGAKVYSDARQASEGPTNYAYNAYLSIRKRVAKLTGYRLWDILVYQKGGYDGYRMSLGEDKIEYLKLEATDDFEKTNFDTKVTVVLNDEELQVLNQDINQTLAQKEITLADAIDCRRLAKINLKYASYVLASRIKRRAKEMSKMKAEEARAVLEGNAAAAKAKSDGDIAFEAAKHEMRMIEKNKELEDFKEQEVSKFAGILKAKIVEGILGQEGKTIDDVPAWVFDGLDIVAKSQKELMLNDMKDMAAAEEEQMLAEQQQAMAEEQQMMAEQEQMQQPMQ